MGFTFTDGSQHGINGINDFLPLFDELEERFEKLYEEVTAGRGSLDDIRKYLPLFKEVKGISGLMEQAEKQHCPKRF